MPIKIANKGLLIIAYKLIIKLFFYLWILFFILSDLIYYCFDVGVYWDAFYFEDNHI